MNMRVGITDSAGFSDARSFFDAITSSDVQAVERGISLADVCDLGIAWLVFLTITFYPGLQLVILAALCLRLGFGRLFDNQTLAPLPVRQHPFADLAPIRTAA